MKWVFYFFCLFIFIPAVVAVLGNKKVPASDVSRELSGSTKDEATAFPEIKSQNLPQTHGGVLICLNIGVGV